MEETTLDSICRGELTLEQPRRGYRFSIDAPVLADFAVRMATPPRRFVDLGAGVGVVGLLVARRWPAAQGLLIELQPELAQIADRNARRNGLHDRVETRCLDLREVDRWRDFSPALAVSNPPFYPVGSGRNSSTPQVSLARHEHACTLQELLAVAARGLVRAGELALIHAADREGELLDELRAHGLPSQLIRRVHPLPDRDPSRVLLLGARRACSAPRELPPLIIDEKPGQLTDEARQILGES